MFYIIKKNFFHNNQRNAVYGTSSLTFTLTNKGNSKVFVNKFSFYKNNVIKLVSYYFKQGLFIKNLIYFLWIFNTLYTTFLNAKPADLLSSDSYLHIVDFSHNLHYNRDLLTVKGLTHWFTSWNTPLFDVDMQKVPKKYKKKIKKKYTYSIKYLKKNQQKKRTLRWIALNNYNYENIRTLKKRTLNNILDTLLNYKSSLIYKRKILIYKKMLKK